MPKTWFITGASRGFGREWTIAALDRGDSVAATARDTATLDDLVERFGDRILPLRLDVTDRGLTSPPFAGRTSTSAGSTSSSTTPVTDSSA
jgi:NADP-dependent 3-hydroxy acid dehydrogenase YdfG